MQDWKYTGYRTESIIVYEYAGSRSEDPAGKEGHFACVRLLFFDDDLSAS